MGGHGPEEFIIRPSRYQWNKFKDLLHFFVMLGVIPASIVVFCTNVFVGPAKLAPIPEGYVPKHWEYHRVSGTFMNLPISLAFANTWNYILPLSLVSHSIQFHVSFRDIFTHRHNKNTRNIYISLARRRNAFYWGESRTMLRTRWQSETTTNHTTTSRLLESIIAFRKNKRKSWIRFKAVNYGRMVWLCMPWNRIVFSFVIINWMLTLWCL